MTDNPSMTGIAASLKGSFTKNIIIPPILVLIYMVALLSCFVKDVDETPIVSALS